MSRDRALMPGAISVARILQVRPIDRAGSGCGSMVNSVCNSEVRRHIDTPMSTLSAHASRRCALVGSMTGLIAISPWKRPSSDQGTRRGKMWNLSLKHDDEGAPERARALKFRELGHTPPDSTAAAA